MVNQEKKSKDGRSRIRKIVSHLVKFGSANIFIYVCIMKVFPSTTLFKLGSPFLLFIKIQANFTL